MSVLLLRPPPSSTLFPYTTLFRSEATVGLRELDERPVPQGRAGGVYPPSLRRDASSVVARLSGTYETFRPLAPDVLEARSEEHTSELQSLTNLVCRLLLEKKNKKK